MDNYILKPIGRVKQLTKRQELIIFKDYKDALLHIDKFSHIIIFWHNSANGSLNNQLKKQKELNHYYNLQYASSLSPIEMSVAQLKYNKDKQGIIGINEIIIPHNAAIVDIKPYFPVEDRVKECSLPGDLSSLPDFYQDIKSEKILTALRDGQFGFSDSVKEEFEINQSGIIRKKWTVYCEIQHLDEETISISLFACQVN